MPRLSLLALVAAAVALPACSEYGLNEKAPKHTEPQPDILVEPSSFNFGEAWVGCADSTVIHITNVGEGTLDLSSVTLEGDVGFFVDDLTASLGAGESTVVQAQFDRSVAGSGRAYVSVYSNDPDEPESIVATVGEATLQPPFAESFVQVIDPVDVLWVIDNSSSMGEEQARVIAEISSFYSWFQTLALDYHMGVVTTDIVTPTLSGRLFGSPSYVDSTTFNGEAEFAESLAVGTDAQGNESGLAAAELALTEPLLSAENAGFYRPDARLVVAFLSDEPEQSAADAAYYIDFFTALKADPSRVLLAAIVGDYTTGCETTCDGTAQTAQPGDKYLDVVNHFGGVFGSICTCDLSPTLDAIGLASTLFVRTFVLSSVPSDPSSIAVWVDGEATTDFVYDAATNELVFSNAPTNGAVISVEYDVAVVCPE